MAQVMVRAKQMQGAVYRPSFSIPITKVRSALGVQTSELLK